MGSIDVVVKYNMLGPIVLGYGGSLYVALEIAIGLAKKGFRVCFNPIFTQMNIGSIVNRIVKYYGIPISDFENIVLGKCSEENTVRINACGDVLTGSGELVYLHFPIFSKPNTYYPELNLFFNTLGNIYYYINKLFYPMVFKDTIIYFANSSFTSKYVERTLNIKPLILYPPVYLDDLLMRKIIPRDEREKIILYVSRISYEKQPFNVILLANILKELDLNDWRIVYAGSSGKYSDRIVGELYREASKRGLSKYIVVKRDLSRSEIIELYRKSYMYVHLFQNEHFGISVVEAMSSGTPVIVSVNSGAWIDIAFRNKEYALPYSNWNDLKESIYELINNSKLWNILSNNGRKRSVYFSRERFHEEIAKYVEEVFNNKLN